jgi:EmrB/QacA subfamily drug resistance transporter
MVNGMSQTPSSPPDSTGIPSRHWWILTTVAFAQLMVILDNTVVNIALPSAQHDLGFSDGQRQWILTAYSLTFGGLLLLGGRMSDLIGRRRTFLISLVGFALASALGGAAPNFGALVGARALQGAFGALLAPTALAVLTTTFVTPRERARAFGVFGAIAVAGGAVGLMVGGVLTENLSWRWNLYINVVIAVIAIAGTLLFIDHAETNGPRPKLDIPGAVLVSGALLGLVYGFSNAESDGWASTLTVSLLVVGVILLIAFVLRQTRAAHPLLPLSIVLDRSRGAAYSAVLIAGVGMFGVFLFLTYYLQTSLNYSPIRTGLAFMPMVLGLITAAQLSTNLLLPRFGPRILVPSGMTLAAISMAYLTHLNLTSSFTKDILPPLVILGLGMGTIMPASIQTATLGVDRQFAGVASALVNTGQQVGGSLGTALLNTLAASAAAGYVTSHRPLSAAVTAHAAVHSYAVAYWWVAGFFAFGAVLTVLLFRPREKAAPEQADALSPIDSAEPANLAV